MSEEKMMNTEQTGSPVGVKDEDVVTTGIKEVAQNTGAMVSENNEETVEEVAKPSFFVKATARRRIELDVLHSKKDGSVISVSRSGMGINFEKEFPFLTHTVLFFEFSVPNYEDMSTYRQRSSIFRREAQQMLVDRLQLRNFLLVWHLKDWNLMDDGKKIELTFDAGGSLSEESLAIVYSLSPTIIDVVMTCYEKEILLT